MLYDIINVETKSAAVSGWNVKCVETLAVQESVACWNDLDNDKLGSTPIMGDETEIFQILPGCPRVDLTYRDNQGWSLVFRAILRNKLGKKMSE